MGPTTGGDNDELDWIPIEGCMGDLLRVEVASAKELDGLVLQPWVWKACREPQVERGEEEGMESSPPTDDNERDNGPFNPESPTESGGSRATFSVNTSKEEQGTDSGNVADQELESESSCEEKETTEETMDEEALSDTKSEGSAATDNILGSITPSSQEVMLLEGPLDLGHPAGGDGGAEQAPAMCGGPDTPMVGGVATHVAHKRQREDQKLKPPTPLSSSMNSPTTGG